MHRGFGEDDTSFPGLLHFTLDPYFITLGVKQEQFLESLVWLDLGLNTGFLG